MNAKILILGIIDILRILLVVMLLPTCSPFKYDTTSHTYA